MLLNFFKKKNQIILNQINQNKININKIKNLNINKYKFI